jgi:hypothetical protein
MRGMCKPDVRVGAFRDSEEVRTIAQRERHALSWLSYRYGGDTRRHTGDPAQAACRS